MPNIINVLVLGNDSIRNEAMFGGGEAIKYATG